MVRGALTLMLLLSTGASAVDFQGRARLWVGPGFDSNARRDYVSSTVAPQPDLFLFGSGQLEGILKLGERVRLLGSYDVSGRKFVFAPTEDTVVQSAQLEGTVTFANYFAVGIAGRVRDRRGAERDYTDLVGGAVLDFFPAPAVDMRVQINAHRFLFYNRFTYSFWGPDGTVSARYRFNRRHSVSLFGSYNPRTYNDCTRNPGPTCTDPEAPRVDKVFGAGLGYSYRGPFQFAFSYSYTDQSSSSKGESVQRHRLNVTAGFRLPWALTLLAGLTWQPTTFFPDGYCIVEDCSVDERDENVSSLTVKVVKPLNKYLDLDVRYAGFLGYLPQNDFLYLRHVVSLGLGVNF